MIKGKERRILMMTHEVETIEHIAEEKLVQDVPAVIPQLPQIPEALPLQQNFAVRVYNKLKKNYSKDKLLGIDITPSCIYVCQVDNNGSSHTLTGLTSVCMEGRFVNEDILNNPNLYSETLKKLLKENKIKTRKVALSLPVSSSIVKFATISKMEDSEIKKAIKYGSLWNSLMTEDNAAANYSIFYQVIRREEHSATMDILVVATRLADIKLYKDIAMKSGLRPVIVDAKCMALHHVFKKRQSAGHALLLEFGAEDNYIMVMGGEKPRIFDIPLSEKEREALTGQGDASYVNIVVDRFRYKIEHIIAIYSRMEPGINIEDVHVVSSLPLVRDFISKLSAASSNFRVHECCMFDYISIPDNFTIKKQCAMNSISSWAGAIGISISPQDRTEEWIEIKRSALDGVSITRSYNKVKSRIITIQQLASRSINSEHPLPLEGGGMRVGVSLGQDSVYRNLETITAKLKFLVSGLWLSANLNHTPTRIPPPSRGRGCPEFMLKHKLGIGSALKYCMSMWSSGRTRLLAMTYTKSTLARLFPLPNLAALAISMAAFHMMVSSYEKLHNEGVKLSAKMIKTEDVTAEYSAKAEELAQISLLTGQLDYIAAYSQELKSQENQQYVLSIYNYLNILMQDGVWLSELNFEAPNKIRINGRSVDDEGVLQFLGSLNKSKAFSRIAMKHMQSVTEIGTYSILAETTKSFTFEGDIVETLPEAYSDVLPAAGKE